MTMNRKEYQAKLNEHRLEKATETALLWLFERNELAINICLKAKDKEEIIALYKKFVSLDDYTVFLKRFETHISVSFYKHTGKNNVSDLHKHPHVWFEFSNDYYDFVLKSIEDMWLTEKEIVEKKEKFINDLKRYEK